MSILLVTLLLAVNAFAQEPNSKKLSNIESLLINNETLLQYDSYEMGIMSGTLDIKFTAMVIADPVKSEIVARGMKVTILGEKDTISTVYLDQEEIENLAKSINAIKMFSAKCVDSKREPYTEMVYSSKGGFKFGYLNKGATSGMFGSTSSLFVKTPDMMSLLKDDEKRINQIQSIINNVMLRITRK
jgi:hypothetical protein